MKALLSLIFLSLIFISCSDDDNPTKSSSTNLVNNWSTDGIYEYSQDRGADIQFNFSEKTYSIHSVEYRRENGQWAMKEPNTQSGNYETDEDFIKIYDEHGAARDGAFWHFSISGDVLTLNSSIDHGGLFLGNSNELIGNTWTCQYSRYREDENQMEYYLLQYDFFNNMTGVRTYKDLTDNETGTTAFTYTRTDDVITIYRENSTHPYVGIFKIKNKKLYLYGKPGTRDNDDYRQLVLHKK